MRVAVTVRKEPLVLGYGGLNMKNPLVLMHLLLTGKNPTKPLQTLRARDPEQGSPLPAAGQKRGLFSHLPSSVARCCREQLA